MKATPEQIVAMKARGWHHDLDLGCFWAGRDPLNGQGALSAQVFPSSVEDEWLTGYGVPGQDYSVYQRYPDPMAAADVAEAWLREEIARFGFPWLAGLQGAASAPTSAAPKRAVARLRLLDDPDAGPMMVGAAHVVVQRTGDETRPLRFFGREEEALSLYPDKARAETACAEAAALRGGVWSIGSVFWGWQVPTGDETPEPTDPAGS
jgi:hypothetical protein